MILAASFGAFIWTAVLIELTPGPNMTYLALLSARRGLAVATAAVAGVAAGLLIVGLTVSLGFGEIVTRSRWLYETIRWAGAGYLLWLAWDAWRGDAAAARQPLDEAAKSAFRDGLVTNLLNPKAAVFYISVLPVFTEPAEAFTGQAARLVLIYVAVATAIHLAIILAADRAAGLLARGDLRQRAGRATALALVVVALWLIVSTRYTG